MNTTKLIAEIQKLHKAIEHDSKDSLAKAMKIGEILEEQKQEIGHGNFIRWIQSDLPFAERTARRYVQLFKYKEVIVEQNIESLIDAYDFIFETRSKLPYQKNSTRKSNVIYTPKPVSEYLHKILSSAVKPTVVLDPAIGKGSLTDPWKNKQTTIIGIDIDPACNKHADIFIHAKFEDIKTWDYKTPDLVICNPPFSNAGGGNLYPEVFLRKCFHLFGEEIKVVMVVPMGFRLNQTVNSERWKYLSTCQAQITSIISLPLDCFKAKFHTEILVFNVSRLKPHYFLYQL